MLSEKIKVKNNQSLVRDSYSGAILNTNLSAVQTYKNKKSELNKINELSNKIYSMESDIKEIKSLLQSLVHGKFNK